MTSFLLEPVSAGCPYCGEIIDVLVDCSLPEQRYVEDCPVCCRPMTVAVHVNEDGSPSIELHDENTV